jgi:hypothetical protein
VLTQHSRVDAAPCVSTATRGSVQALFVRRTNVLKKFIPNFRVVACRIQNRRVLIDRETLFGHGLCKLFAGLRYDTLFFGGCFRFGDPLPIVLSETCDALEGGCHCIELLV